MEQEQKSGITGGLGATTAILLTLKRAPGIRLTLGESKTPYPGREQNALPWARAKVPYPGREQSEVTLPRARDSVN